MFVMELEGGSQIKDLTKATGNASLTSSLNYVEIQVEDAL